MGFKIIRQEVKKTSIVNNEEFINFLLENHNTMLKLRSISIDLDNNSIPALVEEKNKNFDFFYDESRDMARKEAIFDIENSIIDRKEVQTEDKDEVVDRRKRKRK